MAYDPARDPLYQGLADGRTRRPVESSWAISAADMAWAAQQASLGLLGPHTRPLKAPRIRDRGRWGTALKVWTDAGCPDVPPK
jgi:hypothetical protein